MNDCYILDDGGMYLECIKLSSTWWTGDRAKALRFTPDRAREVAAQLEKQGQNVIIARRKEGG